MHVQEMESGNGVEWVVGLESDNRQNGVIQVRYSQRGTVCLGKCLLLSVCFNNLGWLLFKKEFMVN